MSALPSREQPTLRGLAWLCIAGFVLVTFIAGWKRSR